MTLHQPESEVGVGELHDRLSECLERVEGGGEIVVTRHGRPVARLSGLGERPLDSLARRGLVRMPPGAHSSVGAGEGRRLGLRPRLRAAGLIFYLDGSELAAKLWGSAYPVASSTLAYPEGRAALGGDSQLRLPVSPYRIEIR